MTGAPELVATPPSVLLVDDTPANLLTLSAVLKPLGARLVEARSGPEALAHLENETFAVALLDVQMPDMDGFEVAEKMRTMQHGRELPILFLTAIHRDERYQRKGYAAGAADYITKPFDADILRARVKAFVDLFEQREQVRRAQVGMRTRERDEALRKLIAFERISTAALKSSDLSAFLKELLEIFLGAADAADSATILLKDGEHLKVHACLGINEEVDERFTVRMGEGFAGKIASERVAFELADAVSSELVKSQWLKSRGTKGLFGVPLMHEGELLGVAHIGSMKEPSFPETDRRLLLAMAERASWAVASQLKRSRLGEVLAVAPAVISIVRVPSLEYELANPAYCALFDRQNLVGARVSDVGLGDAALALVRRAYVTGQTISTDELTWARPAPHGDRYFRFTAQPLRNHSGTVDSVLTFGVDVTPQVQARREVAAHQAERAGLLERERRARVDAELASRAKDEFLATVSHELRTPLNAILGWAVTARQKAPPELEKALAIIERNARAQSRMIEDVLDISRIVSGKLRLESVNVDLAAVLRTAIESVRHMADAKEIALDVTVDPLPEVLGDPERLQQVVWNLLTNAIKFTPEHGRVTLHANAGAAPDDDITIAVSDTGQGIDPAFLPHVFEPFKQQDGTSTRRHGGLGLGLAIVKQLVTAHHGRIEATSDGIGSGATFALHLPAKEKTRGAISQPPSMNADDATRDKRELRLDGLKVLVVDDDDDARQLLEEILSERGARVSTAPSAADALVEIQKFRPDVLVSDIAMPGGDGYGLIRAVRALPFERGGRTPAVAVTAHARTQDSERAFAAGFQSHLTKPVEIARLVTTVANLGGISFDASASER
jgi:signal transduction histidine kinase/DNA-binding response OmpR family regulator